MLFYDLFLNKCAGVANPAHLVLFQLLHHVNVNFAVVLKTDILDC